MTTASVATAPHGFAEPAEPKHPVRWWGGLAGLIAGFVVVSFVLYLFRWWAGSNDGFTNAGTLLKHMFYIEGADPYRLLLVGLCGAVLGFFGGLLGFARLYRKPTVFRAGLYALIGYAVGAAGTMVVRDGFGLSSYYDRPVLLLGIATSCVFYLIGIGGFSYWGQYMGGGPTPEHEDHSNHGATSWKDYFKFNTDHKVIGIQYVVTTFVFMMVAGLLAELIRAELANPGLQYVKSASTYNELFSVHGTLMIFMFVIPIFAGLANYVLPIMIGAPDMAFPRLNALSYWLLLFGGGVFVSSFIVGAFDTGWTNYAPLSVTGGPGGGLHLGQLMFGMGIQIVGASSIATAVNFIVTIITMRAPGMTMWRMPLLGWANFTTSFLVVFATPFLAGSQFMVLFDQTMKTKFFESLQGGNAIMYQHVFWFYSHPAVYILMIPGFGIISEVITCYARKPLFGYKALAISTAAIGFLSFTVWAHHMFASGMAPWVRVPMMITSMIIAVPTGIKVLGWSATLWNGKIHLNTGMLFALGFLFMFTVGGLTGVMLASIPFDLQVTASYFVVAHFHYVMFGGSVMTIFAGVYHWFPKMTGRMYDERLGRWHFWLLFISANVTFFPMHWLGTMGMTRRIADYSDLAKAHPSVHTWNIVITIGAIFQGVSMMIFFYNMINSWKRGPKAPANPWRALSLEWLVPSPPSKFNFPATPQVVGGPYDFGVPGARHAIVPASPHERELQTVSSEVKV